MLRSLDIDLWPIWGQLDDEGSNPLEGGFFSVSTISHGESEYQNELADN